MPHSAPQFTIITPVRNGRQWIAACLRNVAAQEYQRLEHVVIDGHSTDGTFEIACELAQTLPNVQVRRQRGAGQSQAMNEAIEFARGSVIGILNVDDFYESGIILKAAAAFAEMREPAFVAANCHILNESNQIIGINRPCLDLVKLLGTPFDVQFPCNPSAYFYSRSLHQTIGLYDVHEDLSMDRDFVYRALAVANARHVDEIWGNFRLVPGTKTYDNQETARSRLLAMRRRHFRRLPIRSRLQVRIWQSKVAYWKAVNQMHRSFNIPA